MKHFFQLPARLVEALIGWRRQIMIIVALSAVGAAWVAWKAPFRTSLVQCFMDDETAYRDYRRRAEQLGGATDDIIYLATVEGSELFTPATLNAIRAAAAEIAALEVVAHVIALTDAPWISGRRLSLREITARILARRSVERGGQQLDAAELSPLLYWPRSAELQAGVDLTAMRQAMLQDELIRGVLLARDGQGQAMIVRIREDANIQGWNQVRLRQQLESVLRRHGLGRNGVYQAGVLVIQGQMLQEVLQSIAMLLPCGAFIVGLVVWGIFGSLRVVVMTLVIAVLAITWSVGAAAGAFGEVSLLVAGVPLLILVISTSDTVHLTSAYYEELQSGVDPTIALRRVIRDVGGACALTSATTAMGFISLMVVPAATVRHVALAAAVGVAGALLLALVLAPSFFTRLPQRAMRTGRLLSPDAISDVVVQVCRRWSLEHPWRVLLACGALCIWGLWGASRIRLDADFTARFREGHPARASQEYFQRQLLGVNAMEIYLQVSPEQLLRPSTLASLEHIEQRLRALPEVDSVDSMITLFRMARRALGGPDPAVKPPTSLEAQGMLRLMARAAGMGGAMTSEQLGLTRLVVRVRPTRLFELLALADRIQGIVVASAPSGAEVEVTGAYPIVARAADSIIANQRQGFVLCFVTVMFMVALGIRSLSLSLIAIPPNLAPLLLLGGLLGWTSDVVDSDVLGVAIISFGLAVDDTIHFLHRYELELHRCGDKRVALDATFRYTGRAILETTLILGLGLTPFLLSGFLSLWMLGGYLVFVLFCAVLGDLLMLPALLLVLDRRRVDASVGPA